MPITLNGSGTVSGISAGGLPDGIIQSADLATGVGGKIIQVVEKRLNAGFSTTSSSFVDVTSLSQAITMTNASNKVLIEAPLWVSHSATVAYVFLAIYKGSTELQQVGMMPCESNAFSNSGKWTILNYTDTPGSGTHTYNIKLKRGSTSGTVKISIGGNNSTHDSEKPDMVLRLTEIAA